VFDFGIPEGVQGPPGLDGTGAPVFGQVAKMDAGTITIGAQGVYQSTGLTAVLDGENAGISLGTSDTVCDQEHFGGNSPVEDCSLV
jgi:hypothetical protein